MKRVAVPGPRSGPRVSAAVLLLILFSSAHAYVPSAGTTAARWAPVASSTPVASSRPIAAPLFSTAPLGEDGGAEVLDAAAEQKSGGGGGFRSSWRTATGLSLTALRSSWRAATGISLTALYAGSVAASSIAVRRVMSFVLSIWPTWARYFIQPFLVCYYVPLFVLRGLVGPARERAKAKHQRVVDGWKSAVERASEKSELLVRVNDDGDFVVPEGGDDDRQLLADAVAESVDRAQEDESA